MGENATIPTMGMGPLDIGIAEPPTLDAEFLRSIDRSRRGIDKSKVNTKTLRKAHSTLGEKYAYRIGDTIHFKGTGNRKGVGTIINIDSHNYKIGHSSTNHDDA